MSVDEVAKVMTALKAKKEQYEDNAWTEIKGLAIPPERIEFMYDHAGFLYQAVLVYRTSKLSEAAVAALKSVLETKYNATVAISQRVMGAALIDTEILKKDTLYYESIYSNDL